MKIYTAKEASTKTSIPVRTIQHFCKRDNVRKKLNVYQITDVVLEGWIVSNAKKPRKLKVAHAIARGSGKERIKELENLIDTLQEKLKEERKLREKSNDHASVLESFYVKSNHRKEIKSLSFKLKSEAEKVEFLKEHKSFWMKAAKGSLDTLKTEMGMTTQNK